VTARVLISGAALLMTALAGAAVPGEPVIAVHEADGEYRIAARFTVPEPAGVARDVLTDYANIPRFMPDVQTSVVLERQDHRVRVEQEAVSKYMLFSKRVHLLLDVEEGAEVIRFQDRGNRSFVYYEGSWTIAAGPGHTELAYALAARPAFSVPGFVLRKLLNRDAALMIERLRTEIGARARLR
jgi:hypothetical protein